jgi:hypothetical protein
MIGDAPQTIIARLSPDEARGFIENRRRYGINTLWINLLCNAAEDCNADGTTFDGIAPFTAAGDLTKPNPAFFDRAAEIIEAADSAGMVVLLDPIETGGWLNVLRANGTGKAFAYGEYIGSRFQAFKNIIWLNGNDFISWPDRADDELVQAVAKGIRARDPVHMHTVELMAVASLEDLSWAPLIQLNAAYTYYPAFVQVLSEYNRPNYQPVVLLETIYEFADHPEDGSAQNLRRQGYWTILSGGMGVVYGNDYSWNFSRDGWQGKLNSPGSAELQRMKYLLEGRAWYDLVPDQSHSVLIDGYNGLSGHVAGLLAQLSGWSGKIAQAVSFVEHRLDFGSIPGTDHATAARTPDGSLVMLYLPTLRTVTVDMSKLSGSAQAHWFDPTDGRYLPVAGSPFANSGHQYFTPPGNNAAGDGDWVLLLEHPPDGQH